MSTSDSSSFEEERNEASNLNTTKLGFDPCTGAYIGIDELGKQIKALEKRVAALEKK